MNRRRSGGRLPKVTWQSPRSRFHRELGAILRDSEEVGMAFREASLETSASPARVWQVWSDVNHWPEWNPDMNESRIDGPLKLGTAGGALFGLPPQPLLSATVSSFTGLVAGLEELTPAERSLLVFNAVIGCNGPAAVCQSPMTSAEIE